MSLQAQDVFAALVAALWALLVLGLALRRRSLERRRLERWLSALHPPATDPAPASSAASAALGPAAARLGEACALVHEGCAQGIALEAQAQRVAARAEADLHLFLRSISHALRTPFNALLGFTDVLLEAIDGSITREQRGALEIVRGSTEELSALFDDLLALSDPSAEGLRPPPAPVARPPNLEGIAAERRLQGGARPIEIRAEPSDPPPRFALDRSLDAAASRRAAENSSRAASDDARRRPLRDLLAGWLPGRLGAALAPARGRASASAWVAAALAIPAALLIGSQALGALVWFAPGAMITIAWLAIGSSRSRSRMDQELDRLACWAKGLLALGPGQRPTPLQLGSASLGSLQASLLRLVDRDQRRRAEEARARLAVQEMESTRARLLAYMEHDLRGPLDCIRGFLERLDRDEEGSMNAEQRESLGIMRRAAAELLRLVAEVIDAARLEEGRLDLQIEWHSLATLLAEAVDQAEAILGEGAIAFEVEVQPDLPALPLDLAKASRALVTLLLHLGRRARARSVHVLARREGDRICIQMEARAELSDGDLEEFERVLGGRGGPPPRVSLGPSLARALLEPLGGALEHLGGGRLRLCFERPPETGPGTPRIRGTSGKGASRAASSMRKGLDSEALWGYVPRP